MVIGNVFTILIGIIAVAAIQIIYNTIVSHQLSKLKWIKFLAASIIVLVLAIAAMINVKRLYDVPLLKQLFAIIDGMISTFLGYLPLEFILMFFILPVAIVWCYYLINSLLAFLVKKIQYKKWQKAETKRVTESTEIVNLETSVDVEQKGDNEDISSVLEDTNHFLNHPVVKIKYNSVLGVRRAYELAKAKGVLISETDTGYIAVYADKRGLEELKQIFLENDITSGLTLPGKPSIVFFDKSSFSTIGIQDHYTKINEGSASNVL